MNEDKKNAENGEKNAEAGHELVDASSDEIEIQVK